MKRRSHRRLPLPALALTVLVLAACDGSSPAAPEPLQGLAPDGSPAAVQDAGNRAASDHRDFAAHRPGHGQFGGLATLISVSGTRPNRVATVEVTRSTRGLVVHLVEEHTVFAADGDLVRFGEVLEVLESDVRLRIHGTGKIRDDGSIVADRALVRIPDHDGAPGPVARGWATLESVAGQRPNRVTLVSLANPRIDARIPLAVLERSTTFAPSGDVKGFQALLEALRSDRRVWISARGERNDEGVFVASTVEVEVMRPNDRERDRERDHDRDRDRDHDRDRDGSRGGQGG